MVQQGEVNRHLDRLRERICGCLNDPLARQKFIQLDSGLSQTVFSRIKNGKSDPNTDSLIRISMALRRNGFPHATPNWLLGFHEKEKEK